MNIQTEINPTVGKKENTPEQNKLHWRVKKLFFYFFSKEKIFVFVKKFLILQ